MVWGGDSVKWGVLLLIPILRMFAHIRQITRFDRSGCHPRTILQSSDFPRTSLPHNHLTFSESWASPFYILELHIESRILQIRLDLVLSSLERSWYTLVVRAFFWTGILQLESKRKVLRIWLNICWLHGCKNCHSLVQYGNRYRTLGSWFDINHCFCRNMQEPHR